MARPAARLPLVAALALAAAGGPVRAEEPETARATLAFGFPADGTVRFVRTLESRTGPAPGAAASPTAPAALEKSVTAEVSLENAGRRKDGTFEVLLAFGRVRFASAALLPDGKELLSDRALPKEKAVRAAALPDLVLGGTTTALLVDALGVCRGATEDSLEHKARARALGLDAAEAAALPAHLSGPRLLREYSRAVAALPVPKEPLEVGGTFGIATPVGDGRGRSGFYASQTLKVAAIEADAVVVEGEGRVAWAVDERARKADEPLAEVRVLRSTVASKFRLAHADALPLEGTWEFTWLWEERAPGEESFHRREGREKSTLRRVDAWPSGAK
jgi:hypothetical protein